MLLGVIADDFTGASDIANTIAQGSEPGKGLRTVQYLGVPSEAAGAEVEAGVVALKSRSITAAEAGAQSLRALEWLLAQGCRQIIFKYCSTFDSTPEGNIGQVAEALALRLQVNGVVVCPAFPKAGRTVYKGQLFVGDVPLNESGMERHPLNPMTDANLRRWLGLQSQEPVGLVTWQTVQRGARAIREALDAAGAKGERLVVVDAVADGDLLAIDEACVDDRLITGGSGIALGLPLNFIRAGLAEGSNASLPKIEGDEAILAGSCSTATLRQIEVHAREHPVFAIDVRAAMDATLLPSAMVAFAKKHRGKAPLMYSSAAAEKIAELQQEFGKQAVAHGLDAFFAETARGLVADGVTRLVVAGGETSGAVVSALELTSLQIGPEIDPGVPAVADGGGRIGLALKSGNFGGPDFFEKALRVIGGGDR